MDNKYEILQAIREAKKHLPRLLDAVAHGEVVIITKAGTPVAKLTRVDLPTPLEPKNATVTPAPKY